MRDIIIVGNWKMNKNNAETKAFFEEVDGVAKTDKGLYGVGVPFTDLRTALDNAENLIVAAENCHFEDSGAFTGEVSVPMLEELGVKYCIIGHSERRQMFGDTDETVNKKSEEAARRGHHAYSLHRRDRSGIRCRQDKDVITAQLNGSLKDIPAEAYENIVIAYEPIWAIGTGKSASVEIAEDCCKLVRDVVRDMVGDEAADKVRIQYGGSVKPGNIVEYMAQEDIDGALIGGASLKPDSFIEIIEKTK